MRQYRGYIKTDTSDVESFEFEVPDNATEEDVELDADTALWGSGLIDFWWEEVDDQ